MKKKKNGVGKSKGHGPEKKNSCKKEKEKLITPLLQDQIEREIAALKESDLRRASMTKSQFLQEYSSVLHQAHRG
ncbi:hypothetical protein CHISP_2670 [Chitinispirillum alkaliphilum]|nr:hypothetical protein CHISP_2670 [Chitinispirillum alkaliphilum]